MTFYMFDEVTDFAERGIPFASFAFFNFAFFAVNGFLQPGFGGYRGDCFVADAPRNDGGFGWVGSI
jgi:hypothetical protein